MTENNDKKRESVMRKVQALLDKAASTGFTPEAEECRRKADELMTQYVIEEHELRAAGSVADREKPSTITITKLVGTQSPIKQQIAELAAHVADYVGVQIVYYGMRSNASSLSVKAYGFKAELDYFEMLLTSLMVQMANEMEPKYDPDLSVLENMDNIRGAGVGWDRLFDIFRSNGVSKSQAMGYRQVWLRQNPDQRNLTPTVYLRSFAEGFAAKISHRFWELKQARKESLSSSMALVLVDRSAEVRAFFEEENAGIKSYRSREQRLSGLGLSRGREAAARADLGSSRIGGAPKRSLGS